VRSSAKDVVIDIADNNNVTAPMNASETIAVDPASTDQPA
jgi:hypothetical protein